MKRYKVQKFPILFLVGSGILLILAAWLVSPQNQRSVATPEPTIAAAGHGEETYPEIERVSLENARSASDAGTATLVDVRSAEEYAVSHIPGALNIPAGELENRLGELDPDQWIITYCT